MQGSAESRRTSQAACGAEWNRNEIRSRIRHFPLIVRRSLDGFGGKIQGTRDMTASCRISRRIGRNRGVCVCVSFCN